MAETGASDKVRYRYLVVFSGSGYAAEAMANLVREVEKRGHEVELISHMGLAAEKARSLAEAGMRGLRAAVRTVTGKLTGADPLGLGEDTERKRDVVVTTSPELTAATARALDASALRVGLMTDLGWQPSWTESDNDALIVPHKTLRELCLRRGWQEATVRLGGVPLPQAFSRPLDAAALRQRFGLDPDQGMILLVVAEGVDGARLERLTFQLSLIERPLQPILYVGSDERAREALRRGASKYGVTARMFGEVDNLEEFYAACHLVVAEVSNPLIYPLLALDKPQILFDADIDTRPVGAFLRDEGAAVLVPDLLRLGAEIEALIDDQREHERLAEGARAVVDQQGVQRIADALEALASEREALIARRDAPSQQAVADDENKRALSGGGAFEVIGAAPRPPSERSGASARHNEPRDSGQRGSAPHTPHTPHASPHRSSHHTPDPHVRRLTAAEAKDELAALILEERRVENQLSDVSGKVSLWEGRLDLARDAAEPELVEESQRFLDNYRREESMLMRELDRLRSQKDKLKRRVRPASSPFSDDAPAPNAQLEGRFRSMEIDRDLNRLRSRLDREGND